MPPGVAQDGPIAGLPAEVREAPLPKGRVLRDANGGAILFGTDGSRYLAVRLRFATRWRRTSPDAVPHVRSASATDGATVAFHSQYGGPGSFLVDFQGIDSFLFARAKYFTDDAARLVARAFRMARDREYLRVGAAGAPPTADHPGGEVLEFSLLHGDRLAGRSWTASGYLPPGSEYSRAAPLSAGSGEIRQLRSIYSHTAFLPGRNPGQAPEHLFRVEAGSEPVSALEAVQTYAAARGLTAYAIRLIVRATRTASLPVVVGRVLRRIPHRRLRCVDEATAIASEQTFTLRQGQELHCFGTHYPRSAPAWEAFRAGKPYEPRGHLHMAVRGRYVGDDQHEISHLRELIVTKGTECHVLLDPVTDAIRVEPVVARGDRLVSRCSGRTVVSDVRAAKWRVAW